MDAKFKLSNIAVDVISLVKKGANKKTIIWKSEDNFTPNLAKNIPIIKVDDEQRMVYGIVYSPDEVDTQGDTASADEIRKASERFMREGRTSAVDKQHNYETDEGFVAENWILKEEGDPLFPDEPVGSWIQGIKVEKDKTWQEVKKGEITAFSMAGIATREEISKQSWLDKIKSFFTEKSEIDRRVAYALVDHFAMSIDQAFSSDDPKAKLKESLAEINSFVDGMAMEKAGKVLSSKNLKSIANAIQTLQAVLDSASKNIEKIEEVKMDREQIVELIQKDEGIQKVFSDLVKAAVEGALKPLAEEINETKEKLSGRLDTVEKTAAELQGQDPGQEPAPVEKSEEQFLPLNYRKS